jgi:opacity protein-like surface antigen
MAAISAPTFAQDAPETTAPEFTTPAPSSSSRFDASLHLDAGYDDNIFATRSSEVDDMLFVARPALGFSTGSGGDRLTLRSSAEIGRYADNESENYEDWLIGVETRLRLSPSFSVLAGGDYRWDHENRASPEAVNGLEPTEYERAYGFLAVRLRTEPVLARFVGTVNRFDFSDVPALGGTINNDDRDRTQAELGVRIGHVLDSGAELFVQGSYDNRDYDNLLDDFGYRRNSEGFAAVGGIRHTFSPRLSGEIFVGYMHQDYDDFRLSDISAMDFGAALNWRGSDGLSAALRVERSIEETTLPGASAYILTSGSLSLRSTVASRLSAGFDLRGSHYDYQGDARSEFVTGANLWGRYWFQRHLFFGVEYNLAQRSSNAAGFDYDRNRFLFRLGAQLRPGFAGDGAPDLSARTMPGGGYIALTLGHGAIATGLDGPRGPGSNTADFGDHGASYGAAIGYGALIDNLYIGIEANGQLDGPDWQHTASRVFSLEEKDRIGLAGRLGYVLPGRDLAYGRFGIVSTNFRTRYDHGGLNYAEDDRQTGLEFGLGIDAAAGRRGFIRMEYVLISYGDKDIPTGSGDFDNFSTSESQVRIGGGVRFGAGQAEENDVAPTDFSGFFIGGQFGHGTLVSRNLGTRQGMTAIDIQRASQGPMIGMFAGGGAVFSRIYIGAEVEADISNIDWNIERDPTGRIYSAEHEYSFGARARLGYVVSDSALFYGHVGAVRTRFDIPYATSSTSVRSRETETGLRFGAGMEVGIGTRLRLRLDYSLTDYRSYDVAADLSVDGFDHNENLFRIGFLWRI